MRKLLFSSLLILSLIACKNSSTTQQTSGETGKIVTDSLVLKTDTISASPDIEQPDEKVNGDAKKPGGADGDPKPKPKNDKPSELDSIKNSYPKKK